MVELEDVDRIVRGYLENMVKEAEIDRATRVIDSARPLNYNEVDNYIDTCTMLINNTREQLGTGDYEQAKKCVDKYLAANALDIDKSSVTYGLLCREFLKADIEFFKREIDETLGKSPLGASLPYPQISLRRTKGDAEVKQPKSPPRSVAVSTRSKTNSEAKEKKKDKQLSEVLDAYIAYKLERADWKHGTSQDVIPVLREFVEILDNPSILGLTRETLRTYEIALSRLPSNIKKKPQYRDKPLKAILKLNIPQEDRLSHQTICNKITKVNSFLAWGYEKSGTLPDWASKIIEPPKAPLIKESQQRDVFTKDDLERLFSSVGYTSPNFGFKKSAHFWLPLLGLFTGARLEELAQLYLKDFKEVDGIWCIDINATEDDDKQVKNANAIRTIPIHPVLLDLGIINRVEHLKGQGKKRLFEELQKGKGTTYGDSFSKWFSRFLKKDGIVEEDAKKSFHSFRHTFINYCKQHGINDAMELEVVGHDRGKNESARRYAKDYAVKTLYDKCLSLIDYGIDFSPLKQSGFAMTSSKKKHQPIYLRKQGTDPSKTESPSSTVNPSSGSTLQVAETTELPHVGIPTVDDSSTEGYVGGDAIPRQPYQRQ